MIYPKLRQAFELKIKQFGATNNISVDLENVNDGGETGNKSDGRTIFIYCHKLGDEFIPQDIGVSEEISLLLQVDVMVKQGTASYEMDTTLGLLRQQIGIGACMEFEDACLSVKSFSIGPSIPLDGWLKKPVTLTATCLVAQIER